MPRIILFTILCINFSFAFAQEEVRKVYVCGTIRNYKLKPIRFNYTQDYLYFQRKKINTVLTDYDGNFKITFPWANSWHVQMIIGDKQLTLFLSPGDSLQIDASYGNLYGSVDYSKEAGKGHNIWNEYLKKYNKSNQDFRNKLSKYDSLKFITLNDQYHNEQLEFITKDSLRKENKNFYEFLRAVVDYNYFNNIFEYCDAHKHYFDSTYLLNKFDSRHVNNEYAVSLLEYILFVENYISWLTDIHKAADASGKNFWYYRYNTSKRVLTGKIRDLILARTVKKAFTYARRITAMQLYYDFTNTCYNADYIAVIKKNFVH